VLSIQAWVLLPALLLVLSLGWGLAIDVAAARRLPGALLVPVGLAGVIVVARAVMTLDATAELGALIVAAGGVAGLVLGRDRLRLGSQVDRWAVAAGALAYAALIAPVMLSGAPAFAGYGVLGDTAAHFVLADWMGEHGTELGALPDSSFRQTLEGYFGSGYPLGTHAALASVSQLAFLDVAWAFQTLLAFSIACLALTFYGLLGEVMDSGWRRAAVAALGAQPALVYAYAMQGSIKEVTTMWLIPLMVALVMLIPRQDSQPGRSLAAAARGLLPLAVVSAAAVAAIGLAALVWLGPLLLVALVLVWRQAGPAGPGRTSALAGLFAAAVLLLSLPTLADSGDYVDVTATVVTSEVEFGNLFRPLRLAQVAGIWLSGDYRPALARSAGLDHREVTIALVGLAAVAALIAAVWLWRRRAFGPLLYVGVCALALAYVTRQGSPWADAKALAITAPAVLLIALLGPVALERWGARIPAMIAALLLGGGVLASNAMLYHDVSLSPNDRLQELDDLGEQIGEQGPTLYTDFEEYGKYFLADGAPVGAAEAFEVPGLSPLNEDGTRPAFGHEADLATLRPADIRRFRSLVVRRSPQGEPPPADYRLTSRGRFYELWTRTGSAGVMNGEYGPLAPVEFVTAEADLPEGWKRQRDDRALVVPRGPGSVSGEVRIPDAGRHEVWLRGSFGAEVLLEVDGRKAGSVEHELAQPAGWVRLGDVELTRGAHTVTITRKSGGIGPGDGAPATLGSLAFGRPAGVATIPAGSSTTP
jgi:hypothetical protein